MKQIAEIFFAEGVISHVLHQAASIGEGMRVLQFVGSSLWEALQEHWPQLVLPRQIHDLLMRQNGIRGTRNGTCRNAREQAGHSVQRSHRGSLMQSWISGLHNRSDGLRFDKIEPEVHVVFPSRSP